MVLFAIEEEEIKDAILKLLKKGAPSINVSIDKLPVKIAAVLDKAVNAATDVIYRELTKDDA